MIRVATRKSPLAQTQADLVIMKIRDELKIRAEKILIQTKGDIILDVTPDKIGEKGIFIKELEKALIEAKADCAVHSMKDLPTLMEEDFAIAAVPFREDPRDVFVSAKGVDFYELKKGAKVGTSSIRRALQVKTLRPDVDVVPIRGNVETRIEKMEQEGMDGIILAAAGLRRLGISDKITNYFDVEEIIPACGQGAIAVETLKDSEYYRILKRIDDIDARLSVDAERRVLNLLDGGCNSPICAHALISGDYMRLVGLNVKGGRIIKKAVEGKKEDYLILAERLAEMLL